MPSVPSPTRHPRRATAGTSNRPTPLFAFRLRVVDEDGTGASRGVVVLVRQVDRVCKQRLLVEQVEPGQPLHGDRPRTPRSRPRRRWDPRLRGLWHPAPTGRLSATVAMVPSPTVKLACSPNTPRIRGSSARSARNLRFSSIPATDPLRTVAVGDLVTQDRRDAALLDRGCDLVQTASDAGGRRMVVEHRGAAVPHALRHR